MRRLATTARNGLARLLFPPLCAGCVRHVATPGTLCPECWPKLRFIDEPCCAILGTPFAHDMGDGAVSPEAIANPPVFRRARAAVAFAGPARDIVHALKYRDRTDLARWMAVWMRRAGAELIADCDLIVPVPLHRMRFLSRRFNQSAELARALSSLADRPYLPVAVERVKATRQQVGLPLAKREDNVRGAFRVSDALKGEVAGRTVLLIDDVFTTGATVSAVARALLKAGAREVDVLTFARVLPGDFLSEAGTLI